MLVFRLGYRVFTLGGGVGFWKDEIWFKGTVKPQTADKIVKYLQTTKYDRVSFFLNSTGGDTSAMDRIIDAIDEFNKTKQLDTYCVGMVASSAFEIFLTGKERVISKDSLLMFHDAVCDFSACGKDCYWTVKDLKERVAFLNTISKASRIWVAHRTGLSVRALKRMTKEHKEKWFSTDECIKYKIATKVLD